MSETPCRKDEDWGSKWGRDGKTAKMMAAQTCSDRGFYSHSITDCGWWNFKANCWEGIPSNWSRPISDEAARERGFANRNEYAKGDCRSKGFLGADPNQWRDRGQWMFSLKCVNPDWHGDWRDEGCRDDGNQQFARHVNSNGMSWEESADWLINRLPGTILGRQVVNKWRENRGGAGMWVVVRVVNNDCKGGWIGDWIDDGCEPDGARKYSRRVDAKGRRWEDAASHMIQSIGNVFNGKSILSKRPDNRGAGGMWVVITIADNLCFGEFADATWKDDGCQNDQSRRFSRKVQAHKRDWNEAADYVNQNLVGETVENKKVLSKSKDVNASGAWSWAFVEDNSCQPSYKGEDWNDDGCQADGRHRYARQVDDKNTGNWEAAAETLIKSDKTPKVGDSFKGGKVSSVASENKGTAGMWIIVLVDDNRCFGEFADTTWKDDGCQKDQSRRFSRKVQAHKRDWNEATDYVNQNLIGETVENKKVLSKSKDVNASGAWSWAFVEDNSCQPSYKGEDWNDDGCQADGRHRYARQVDDKNTGNWEAAAETLIKSDKTPKVGDSFKGGKVSSVNSENKGTAGMWVIVLVDDNCQGEFADTTWKDDGCQTDQSRRFSRKVQSHKRDWNEAADYVNQNLVGETVEDKKVLRKSKDVNTFGAWSWAFVEDNSCQAKYKGEDWDDEGCQADNRHRYTREVDNSLSPNSGSLGVQDVVSSILLKNAADILIKSDKTPKVGDSFKGGKVSSVNSENKGTAGMWVIILVDDASCDVTATTTAAPVATEVEQVNDEPSGAAATTTAVPKTATATTTAAPKTATATTTAAPKTAKTTTAPAATTTAAPAAAKTATTTTAAPSEEEQEFSYAIPLSISGALLSFIIMFVILFFVLRKK
jgi:hypothetical protein